MTHYYDQKESGEVISDSYVQIAKYVAQTRAYPSILDGMKAVYRRMVYASKDIKSKVKSNIITAETMKYHPHSEAYGTLVSMTCKYGKLPLFTGYGNFGGLGFGPSASRYTSAVLNEIGRLLYLELVDTAEYVEGDAGLMEPKYLPSLIPYALITGDRGMTVGLPTPEIPSFDLMELIEYCKSKLLGKECKYPRPDYGDCIINSSQEDLKPLYETGYGVINYKIKFTVIDNKVIITDFPPNHHHWNCWKKIQKYVDDGVIDFLDCTDEDGLKFEYTLKDSSVISMDELLRIFDKYAYSKVTYRMYFEKDGSVYLCPFDFVISKSQEYLKECAIRKFDKEIIAVDNKIKVLRALKMLRESSDIKYISEKSSQYFKDLIMSWEFEKWVADSVMNKSISYLTTSHDSEFEEILNYKEYLLKMREDPTEYLISLYDKLIELVKPLYLNRNHSIWASEVVDISKIGYSWNNSKIRIGLIDNGYLPFNNILYEVFKDGRVRSIFLNKTLDTIIDSDASYVIGSNSPKYLILTHKNFISVIPTYKISNDFYNVKIWDNVEFDSAFLAESDNVRIFYGDKSLDIHLPDWLHKRSSFPDRVFRRNADFCIKEVISI